MRSLALLPFLLLGIAAQESCKNGSICYDNEDCEGSGKCVGEMLGECIAVPTTTLKDACQMFTPCRTSDDCGASDDTGNFCMKGESEDGGPKCMCAGQFGRQTVGLLMGAAAKFLKTMISGEGDDDITRNVVEAAPAPCTRRRSGTCSCPEPRQMTLKPMWRRKVLSTTTATTLLPIVSNDIPALSGAGISLTTPHPPPPSPPPAIRPSCVSMSGYYVNEDCGTGGMCMGPFAGTCNCNFIDAIPCRGDRDCGGLVGSCDPSTGVCANFASLTRLGFPTPFDVFTKFCNVQKCSAANVTSSCHGLACTVGSCVCPFHISTMAPIMQQGRGTA